MHIIYICEDLLKSKSLNKTLYTITRVYKFRAGAKPKLLQNTTNTIYNGK